MNLAQFKKDLTEAINKNSMENVFNCPDHILADLIISILLGMEGPLKDRDNWFNFKPVFYVKDLK